MEKNDAILITGANGFIGKNLCCELRNRGYTNLLCFDVDTEPSLLAQWTQSCRFVFHLAGINRPQNPEDFYVGNRGFTEQLLHLLREGGNKCPVLVTSSAQAELDNDYGKSKKEAEDLVFAHGETGAQVFVFRLPGVFGKWCRPAYNSVVATFCYNTAHGLPCQVRDVAFELPLVYIDDVVACFLTAMETGVAKCDRSMRPICLAHPVYTVTLGWLADTLQSFAASRSSLSVPRLSDAMTSKLYSTYLSYLPPETGFSYPLQTHTDTRGSFTEFLRSPDAGQVSVNVAHPGIVKGNHWHHSKNEKFLVVSGKAVIRFRKVDEATVYEYRVSGEELCVVDIPTGYTHNIENIGTEDLVTIMWANEPYDPDKPDTWFLPV